MVFVGLLLPKICLLSRVAALRASLPLPFPRKSGHSDSAPFGAIVGLGSTNVEQGPAIDAAGWSGPCYAWLEGQSCLLLCGRIPRGKGESDIDHPSPLAWVLARERDYDHLTTWLRGGLSYSPLATLSTSAHTIVQSKVKCTIQSFVYPSDIT